jgi:hypothetical protein
MLLGLDDDSITPDVSDEHHRIIPLIDYRGYKMI